MYCITMRLHFLLSPKYFLACIFVNKLATYNGEDGNKIFCEINSPLESMQLQTVNLILITTMVNAKQLWYVLKTCKLFFANVCFTVSYEDVIS